MTYWDKIINQTKIDSALISDLSDLSYAATKGRREKIREFRNDVVNLGKLPFLENPPPNAITKEMIQNYHQSIQEPIRDPITNDILPNKYFPSAFKYEIADLQQPPVLEDDVYIGTPATIADIDNVKDDIKNVDQNLTIEKQNWDGLKNKLIEQRDILNRSGISRAVQKKTQKYIQTIEQDIRATEGNIKALEKDLQDKQNIMESFITNIETNKQIVIRHNQEIKLNLEKYRESLLALNRNRLRIEEKLPNETDEDYLQRMKDIETEQQDVDLYKEKAALHQILILKKNLRNIFNKDDLIENIVKSYKPEEIYIINTYFKQIQEYFLETFGQNNTNLKLSEIIDIIKGILYKIQNPVIEYEIEPEEPTAAAAAVAAPTTINQLIHTSGKPTDFEYGTDNDAFYIGNSKNGNHIWFKVADVGNGKKILLYSNTDNARGNFKQVMERHSSNTNEDDVLSNIVDKYLNMNGFAKHQLMPKEYRRLNNVIQELETKHSITPLKQGISSRKSLTGIKRYGYGIAVRDPEEELPQYTDFGNLVIMPRKLYYKNILSLKMKNGHSIEGLHNTKVSNLFVDIIMDMYKNKNITSTLKSLNPNEQHLMNSILYQAGLHKKYSTNNNDTLKYLKDKHKILEGEILSGNNNPELLKELKEILLNLYHLNAISLPSLKKYLKQFK